MKRLAVEKICGWSFLLAISISVTTANGQYYDSYQSESAPLSYGNDKQPLNQLPPIVSSNQVADDSNMLQPVKQLYLPPVVSAPQDPAANQQTINTGATTIQVDNPQLSKAGVPIYSGNHPVNSQVQYSGSTGEYVGQAAFYQGSGSRNLPSAGSGTRTLPPIVNPEQANANTLPTQDFSNSLAPGDLPVIPEIEIETPATVIETPRIISPSPGFSVPATPGTNDYFQTPAPAPAANGGIAQTGNAGCSSCGPDGCYDLANVQSQMGCCGSVVSAGYYMFFDVIGWTRAGNDGDVQLSQFAGLNDFGYAGGLRLTLGYRQNATQGRELTYFGTSNIGESILATSTTNGLNPTFTAGGGFNFGDVSGFFNANTHFQRKTSMVQSLEYNRVNWGWDVVKTMFGARYIYFQDDYYFFSSNGVQNGLFTQDSINNFFGLSGGFELFYDVGYRSSVSITNKYGAYVNSANIDTNLFNGGIRELSQDTDESAFAGTVEIGLMGHFQVAPKARLRASWDILLMWGAFTIENNIPRDTFARGFQTGTPIITPMTGSELNTNNQPVFFSGLSLGFEIFR